MGASLAVAVRFRLDVVLDEIKQRGEPISQSELSRRSGLSMTTINAMMLNKSAQVSLKTLDAICGALGITPGDLFEREEERPKRRRGT